MKKQAILYLAVIVLFSGLFSCSTESSEKEILSFTLNELNPPVKAVISGTNITATVPDNTDITDLAPDIQVSDDASVSPASGVAQNFSSAVTYKVTAEDGSIKSYLVAVHFEGEPENIGVDWIEQKAAPHKRAWATASTVNDKIYLIGGLLEGNLIAPLSTIDVYDPSTDSWDTTKSSLTFGRWAHSATVVDGKIYVMGGISGILGSAIKGAEVYNPATDNWEQLQDMPHKRAAHGACVLDGKIYLVGGEEQEPAQGSYMSSADMYDPANNTWTALAPLPLPTTYLSACSYNGKIYAIGGVVDSGGTGVENVFEYDPQSDSWEKMSNIKTPRWSLTTCTIDGFIYCIGGSTGGVSSGSTRVEVYVPEYDICLSTDGLVGKCYGQGTSVYNGKIYVLTGCVSPPPLYETYTDATQVGTPLINKKW